MENQNLKYLFLVMGLFSIFMPTILSYNTLSHILSYIIAVLTVVLKITMVKCGNTSATANLGSYISA